MPDGPQAFAEKKQASIGMYSLLYLWNDVENESACNPQHVYLQSQTSAVTAGVEEVKMDNENKNKNPEVAHVILGFRNLTASLSSRLIFAISLAFPQREKPPCLELGHVYLLLDMNE